MRRRSAASVDPGAMRAPPACILSVAAVFVAAALVVLPAAAETPASRLPTPTAAPAAGVFLLAQAMPPLPRPKPPTQSAGGGGFLGDLLRGAGAVADFVQPSGEGEGVLADIADGSLGLRTALRMFEDGDTEGATRVAAALPDRADTLLVHWTIATTGGVAVSSARIREAIGRLEGWPAQALMRLRYEQAVIREAPDAAGAIAAFPVDRPTSEPGVLMLARAFIAAGRGEDAAALLQPYWRTQNFSREAEDKILAEFPDRLTAADHRFRLIRLLYANRNDEALRVAALLDADTQKLAAAFAAVNRRNRTAGAALDAVPQRLRADIAYRYARATWLRRAGRISDAAEVIMATPDEGPLPAGGDLWAEMRRDLARFFLDRGNSETAYRLLTVNPASGRQEQVELEFQAGWYALRFRDDPAAATRHFARLKALSPTSLTQSRAEYWLAQTAEAQDNATAARAHYEVAAGHPTTFYGQLAAAKLDFAQIEVTGPVAPDESLRERLQENDLARAADRLAALERPGDAALFARLLAERLDDPADVALLAASAEQRGAYQLGLQIGIIAAFRLPVQTLAFPTTAIPAETVTGTVDRAILYAIARQESRFDQVARSPAGALGLLQLMPPTARETAGRLGLPYSQSRLTSDPAYNATLGAAHFASVFEEWGDNFVLSFAAYNAGSGRVRDWIAAYGDPRNPRVDVIDWIEHIPFDETRNYVQRVMENLQVYRARTGGKELQILADLGRPG